MVKGSESFETFVDWLAQRLGRPLPGWSAHRQWCPRPRSSSRAFPAPNALRPAAVVVLLVPDPENPRLPALALTRRTAELAHHGGQICLPGGALHEGEDAADAARRELGEELRIDPAGVRLLGTLSPITIPVSSFRVTPFVGVLGKVPVCDPDPSEVAELIWAPLADLFAPSRRQSRWERRHDTDVLVPFYEWGVWAIWGATAMMLGELQVLFHQGCTQGTGSFEQLE